MEYLGLIIPPFRPGRVQPELYDVLHVVASARAFCALRRDGAETWSVCGSSRSGGLTTRSWATCSQHVLRSGNTWSDE